MSDTDTIRTQQSIIQNQRIDIDVLQAKLRSEQEEVARLHDARRWAAEGRENLPGAVDATIADAARRIESLSKENAAEKDAHRVVVESLQKQLAEARRENADYFKNEQALIAEFTKVRESLAVKSQPTNKRIMSREDMAKVMEAVFEECRALRGAGQKEYAHREDNAFGNFDRVAERMGLAREQVLMVYCEKHLDGVHSWIKGHRSQRESVKGRIDDVIVYMCLLRGMVDLGESANATSSAPTVKKCVVVGCTQDAGMHEMRHLARFCELHANAEQKRGELAGVEFLAACEERHFVRCAAFDCDGEAVGGPVSYAQFCNAHRERRILGNSFAEGVPATGTKWVPVARTIVGGGADGPVKSSVGVRSSHNIQ